MNRWFFSCGLLLIVALSLALAQDDDGGSDGAAEYQRLCAACHMSDGSGGEGVGIYPDIADNPNVAASADFVIIRILHGYGAMPPFPGLSDEAVAAIVNHVRVALNDADDEISAEDVAAVR